ncbi:MAG: glycoside hydrolase family 36 protein [Kiritimatiellia bacterium]|jgi:hypothetical protein
MKSISENVSPIDARRVWTLHGDFGSIDGTATVADGRTTFANDTLAVEKTVEAGAGGVRRSQTIVRNVSQAPIALTTLFDRFEFDDGDIDIYTQVNIWQNESRGAWQCLHTGIAVRGCGMRTTWGAAPVLAVWNEQAKRGRVFHLMSDATWEMRAERTTPTPGKTAIAVETGVDPRHLHTVLKPGDSFALPEVVSYDFTNKLDLDCHKLHAWWNATHPAPRCPTLYNTWLCRYHDIDVDLLLKQVACASRLGLEYFVVDSGWYGPKDGIWEHRGDWSERPDGLFQGRLSEISEAVRAAGMKFGFWMEAEIGGSSAQIVRDHPEDFRMIGGNAYLDFAKASARERLLETTCALIERYQASFIKFDWNNDRPVDPTGRAFADYNAGYRTFLRAVRERNPGIYLCGCASGGLMMDLGWAREFDSFWLSDNQSIGMGLRIARETMLRLPPRLIERWLTVRSLANAQPDFFGKDERLVSTEDANWRNLRSYPPESAAAFAAGGPLGFSCDLTALSESHFAFFKRLVEEHQADEAFWARAVGRVLCAGPTVQAVQCSDEGLADVRIFVAVDGATQTAVTVAPVLNPAMAYACNDATRSGADWMAAGIRVEVDGLSGCEIRLRSSTLETSRFGGQHEDKRPIDAESTVLEVDIDRH